ncbi:hypothetical protein PTTG_25655 [Puccinia triticina 1-1 BBBD Race 1]|uniref:Uncharacterized protein n=2 Tax=Puccinia triticina TaxID=208348 RepID=A0A180GZZ3_PUCT1|nr:uncharacterized protein PtA15_9A445 [Puccinia triticina]OAV98417.1 hypothetical protein PTTG_25655 [Puccinia triticina 1-1 BBBD Race 1]WAQ88318.1 hypothetical protein PtA15_9A445 [Puccinia triticina]WAR60496.1 hypothetical protein PtB15_9B435 [Puccinia triticina]
MAIRPLSRSLALLRRAAALHSSTPRPEQPRAAPARPPLAPPAKARLSPARKLIGAASRRVVRPDLAALLVALGHPAPVPVPLPPAAEAANSPSSPVLNGADFDRICTTRPALLRQLSPPALALLLRYILASRFDSFTLRLVENSNRADSAFTAPQRIAVFQLLISLARTKRQWLTADDKSLIFVSDAAVSSYFGRLLQLVAGPERHGLGPEDLRCVMRALRRSSDALFWEPALMRQIWQEIIRTESNDNRRRTNARLGLRSVLHWISNHHGPPQPGPSVSQLSPAMWSLCLQVWSQLLEWGEIAAEDLNPAATEQTNVLSPADQAILTMLSPIIRSASRRYAAEPLDRDNAKLFKNACEALQLLISRSSSTATSSTVEELVPQLTNAFLHVVHLDHRAPAPEIAAILTQYPGLPTVSDRWSREGISAEDYRLYGRTLETIHGLGRASLLVSLWLDLLPMINVGRAGWPLDRLLTALGELANPLVRAVSGKPLNGFRLARLVLRVVRALASEDDPRLVPSRRRAFRMLVERPDLHGFDWLAREERQFDRDGNELECVPAQDSSRLLRENIETIFGLWQASWALTKRLTSEAEGEPVLLPTLVGVTRLAQTMRSERTVLLLKMVISRFVADRTPPLTAEEARSKYLHNPQARLTDIERTRLIEAHLSVGGELSRRFIIDLFRSFLHQRIVPSVEDLKLLHAFLTQIDPLNAQRFWADRAAAVNGLPWSLFDHSKAFPVAWDHSRIQIAKELFVTRRQSPTSSKNSEEKKDSDQG